MSGKNSSGAKLIIVLVAIATGSATLLSLTRAMTADAIKTAEFQETLNAIQSVLPPFSNDPAKEAINVGTGEEPVLCYPARNAQGELIGIAVPGVSHKAYGGDMVLMVGIRSDGTINGIQVLTLKETPGLGTRVADEKFQNQFIGKGLGGDFVWKVRKDGGSVDAITGATISSRAATEAIQNALERFERAKKELKQ